jgi:hypothetical protein
MCSYSYGEGRFVVDHELAFLPEIYVKPRSEVSKRRVWQKIQLEFNFRSIERTAEVGATAYPDVLDGFAKPLIASQKTLS